MNIGILTTFVQNNISTVYYNSQDLGLAKELVRYYENITIYRVVGNDVDLSEAVFAKIPSIEIKYMKCPAIGKSGMIDINDLDPQIAALVYFSDTQFDVPKIYRWCRKNKILMIPYIGVVDSHSTNRLYGAFVRLLFDRNIRIYKKCNCMTKTPTVQERLRSFGVNRTVVAPVGLDLTRLRSDYSESDKIELKKKYGFDDNDRIILFIGRMAPEKRPLDMVELFEQVLKRDPSYKLLMVGKGGLDADVNALLKQKQFQSFVKIIQQIPNDHIWELYRISDCYINLNRQEIFGMAILEAMYYECKVIACHAPGPNLIIQNGKTGWLVDEDEIIVDLVFDKTDFLINAHERVVSNFSWRYTAGIVDSIIRK